jgi:4-carboxymuconolactone decarboxylase
MTLLDPTERTRAGVQQQTALTGAAAPQPKTVLDASWRDFVFAEVWTRPGLDRRSRLWIAMAGAACTPGPPEILDGYIRGALTLGEVELTELREGALHLAVYAGWPCGASWDAAITRVAEELKLPPAPIPSIRADPWDPAVRISEGTENFTTIMTSPPGPPMGAAYFDAGILNFVFGEMWMRPGLDQRARRWITLVGVANSSTHIPVYTHTHAAMASGDATAEEMHEFVLQFAVHCGWPKGSVMLSVVFEMADRVARGLPWTDNLPSR